MNSMKSPCDLTNLCIHKKALLLAEAAAWLHMLGKYYEGFLDGETKYAKKLPLDMETSDPEIYGLLADENFGLLWRDILRGQDINPDEIVKNGLSIKGIIKNHHNPNAGAGFVRLMQDAHGRGSDIEKGVLHNFAPKQNGVIFRSNAFGIESVIDREQIVKRRKELYIFLVKILTEMQKDDGSALGDLREKYIQVIQDHFRYSLADFRRPLNDITLHDQTFSAVAFFKASLAKIVLTGWEEPTRDILLTEQKYHWQLLRIGLNGPAFWERAVGINDLLSRKKLISPLLDKVQSLLEQEYPLGMEVYRDENGSIYIVPDIDHLLDYNLDSKTLGEYLNQIASDDFDQELTFSLYPPAGNYPNPRNRSRSMRIFGEFAARVVPEPTPLPTVVNEWWRENAKGAASQICSVCGVRPQGYKYQYHGQNQKALARKVCTTCEERRDERSKEWSKALNGSTIWMNEVADQNGRLALIVGYFDMDNWLSGAAYNTLMTVDPNNFCRSNKASDTKYDLSFHGLRKEAEKEIVELGRSFEDGSKVLKYLIPPCARGGYNQFEQIYRLYVDDPGLNSPSLEGWRFALALMRLQPSFARIRRFWESTWGFWKAIDSGFQSEYRVSIPRISIQGNFTPYHSFETLGKFHAYEIILAGERRINCVWDFDDKKFIIADNLHRVASFLSKDKTREVVSVIKEHIKGKLSVLEPSGYGSEEKEIGEFEVQTVEPIPDSEYSPYVPILVEPGTFVALLPAENSLQAFKTIRQKYQDELGKVANRLPIHIGIVYTPQHTPIRAVINAGRRMLSARSMPVSGWSVLNKKLNDYQAEILLEKDGHQTTWQPKLQMGNHIKDVWYPYAFVEQCAPGSSVDERSRHVFAPNPWTQLPKADLVHICEIQEGDVITFTPSTFDFEWLDSASRRFEIAYDDEGRRFGNARRPYLLSELETLEDIWKILSGCLTTKSQIYALRDLIEDRRESWQPTGKDSEKGGVFWQFCRDAIRNADWQTRPDINWDDWAGFAVRGWLTDAVELHLHILKEEIRKEELSPNLQEA